MKKKPLNSYMKAGITAFLVIISSIFFFFIMFHMKGILEKVRFVGHILRPIFMGMVIAFLLLPVYKHIFTFFSSHRFGLKKPLKEGICKALSIGLSLIFAFLVLYILLAMVIPQVYVSVVGLIESVPQFLKTAQQWIVKFLKDNTEIQETFLSSYNTAALSFEEWLNREIIPNLESLSSTLEWARETLLPNITGVITNVSILVKDVIFWLKDLLIAVIVSIYLLARKDVFAAQCKKMVYSMLPPRYGDLMVEETRNAYRIMSGFINGKLLDSLIIGLLTFICCTVFFFPYPALIATIIGVTNIIPFFGPFIGAIPSAVLIFLVDPMKCLYFVIFVFILQQCDGIILGPKILGDTTGLASFWVLFSILLFGGLFGFAGMVFGVPFFAVIYSVVRRLVNRGLRKRNLPVETFQYMGITGKMSEIVHVTDRKFRKNLNKKRPASEFSAAGRFDCL